MRHPVSSLSTAPTTSEAGSSDLPHSPGSRAARQRARNSAKTVQAACLCCLLSLAAVANAQSRAHFNLPAEPLADALRAVAGQTSSNILFDRSLVQGLTAPLLQGELTTEEALQKLLDGTGLTYRKSDYKTITILAQPATAPVRKSEPSQPVPRRIAEVDEGKVDRLEEIVVTATKQKEPLDKVPISIAAYTAETLDRAGIRNVVDIARFTPGLDFVQSGFASGSQNNIAIRGVYSDSGAATTGVYIDDVAIQQRINPSSNFGSAYPLVFDLERVEVERGPQGTLFGAGAEGGAVRFITRTPDLAKASLNSRTEVSSTAHGDPSYEVGVAGSVPLREDVLAVSASAWARREGGFVEREPFNTDETFRDVNHNDAAALRLSFLFQPLEMLTLMPSVYYQTTSVNDSSNFWSVLTQSSSASPISGAAIRQPTHERFVLPSLKADVKLAGGALNLTSITAYFGRSGDTVNDYTNQDAAFITQQPFPTLPGQSAPSTGHVDQQVFSQEVRLSSAVEDSRVKWTVGLFYSRAEQQDQQDNEDLFAAALFGAPLEDLFGVPLYAGRYVLLGGDQTVDKQSAIFAQADIKLTRRLSAIVGGRYSRTTLDFTESLAGPFIGSNDLTPQGGRQSANPVTPKLGLNFQADDKNLFYASFAKGFRVGGVNLPLNGAFACGDELAKLGLSAVPSTYNPDSTRSYEVGAKSRIGGVRAELSAFFIDWADIQQFVSFPSCGGAGFTSNLGRAVSRGFDLQATATLLPSLFLTGAAGYTNTEFSRRVGTDTVVVVNKGDTLPGAPWKLSVALDSDFHLPFAEGYAHVDDQYRSHNGGRRAAQDDPLAAGYDPSVKMDPAVNQLNLRLGLVKTGVDASLFVDNLLDARPNLGSFHDLPSSPLYYYNTIRPRTIGLTVTYRR